MNGTWVAGSVRAAAIARRRLGTAGVANLASCPRLSDAVDLVAQSPYGHDVVAGAPLAAAERGVAAATLWNVRVLAGWLPAAGATTLRALAGWFEIANTDEHMLAMSRRTAAVAPFHLGSLATAWPRIAATQTLAEVRAVLAGSAWGDPGEETAHAIGLAMRLSWAARVSAVTPDAGAWASGGAALLVAREQAAGRSLPAPALRSASVLLGPDAVAAITSSPVDFSRALNAAAAWALASVASADDLWRAEVRWWQRLYADGLRLLKGRGFGEHKAVGAVAVLAADAWRVNAALAAADRGGADDEARDALG